MRENELWSSVYITPDLAAQEFRAVATWPEALFDKKSVEGVIEELSPDSDHNYIEDGGICIGIAIINWPFSGMWKPGKRWNFYRR